MTKTFRFSNRLRWIACLVVASFLLFNGCRDDENPAAPAMELTGTKTTASTVTPSQSTPPQSTPAHQLISKWHDGEPPIPVDVLVKQFRKHVKAVEDDKALGRDPIEPAVALVHLLKETEAISLTGVEAGLLLCALFRASAHSFQCVLDRRSHGSTSLRHRVVGIRLNTATIILPFAHSSENSSAAQIIDEKQRRALMSGMQAIGYVEKYAFQKAHDRVTSAMKADPKDSAYQFLRGQIFLMQGDFDAGVLDMEAAVNRQEDAHGRYQLGMAALQLEQSFKAYQALRRAVELRPEYGDAWHALGVLSLNRLETADANARSAVGHELDEVEGALVRINANHVRLFELRARRALAAGEMQRSRQIASDGIKANKDSPILHGFLAELAMAAGEVKEAVHRLEEATKIDSTQADYWLFLASLYGENGDVQKALHALEQAVEAAPFNPEIRAELVRAYQSTDQAERAQKVGVQLMDDFPDRIEGSLVMIELAILNSEYKTVIDLATKAARKHPDNTDLQQALFLAHAQEGEFEAAKNASDKMVKIDPKSRIQLVEMLLEMGAIEPALLLLEQEIQARPKDSQAAMNLALLYRRLGRPADETRIRDWMLKHSVDPKSTETLYEQIRKELDSLENTPGQGE